MTPLLQVRNLAIGFGEVLPVVRGVSFQLAAGQTLALVGESGSGKSLTCSSIVQLFSPGSRTRIVQGEVLFSLPGQPTVDLARAEAAALRQIRRKAVGMVFQEPMSSLNPVRTVGEQVAEVLPAPRQARAAVLDWFARVQLPDPARLYGRYPHQLSGGQQQRVVIAMALARHPALLLADEPTTALDATVQQDILLLLRDLQREMQLAMLFVTHDLGLVSGFAAEAGSVLVLQEGCSVEQGRIEDVFAAPKHPYTRGLLACRPRADWHPRRLPTVASVLAGAPEPPQAPVPQPAADAPVLLEVAALQVTHAAPNRVRLPWQAPRVGFRAVDGVSLRIRAGETLGLVGESGSGKSTVARAVMGLLPYSGQVLWQGAALPQHAPRNGIQLIFQDPYAALNPRMRVVDILRLPMARHGIGANAAERRQLAAHLLDQVGLPADSLDRYPHAFSGGQRQRICIARALALRPQLLVCDESVSALDVSVQAQVLNLLADLRDQLGLSLLFISHDLNVVRYFCSSLVVLHRGQVVESGAAAAVFGNPQSEVTRRLLAAVPGAVAAVR